MILSSNLVGTNEAGTGALGNQANGILIFDSADNLIGGVSTIGGEEQGVGNVIAANVHDGVQISGNSHDNSVFANWIGTGFGGADVLGNGRYGVAIINSFNNVIGSQHAGGSNVIVNNDAFGIAIAGPTATGNRVEASYIGVVPGDMVSHGNSLGGILIFDAPANTIGRTQPDFPNVISGNEGPGVQIEGGNAKSNQLLANYIGTDTTGAQALGNQAGVLIQGGGAAVNSPSQNIVRSNLISGNLANGVVVRAGASLNAIEGNTIGGGEGTGKLGNGGDGVLIDDAPNNTIGSDDEATLNLIEGNVGSGVRIHGSQAGDNMVLNNEITANSTGITLVEAPRTLIHFNRVYGNTGEGVFIGASPGTTVTDNKIGTDSDGLVGIPNRGPGIMIVASPDTMIGGESFQEGGNLISGNGDMAIFVNSAESIGTFITGNIIGLDMNATHAVGNQDGVVLAGSDQGNSSKAYVGNNIIAGNRGSGVVITGGAFDNTVADNYIGVNRDLESFGNGETGVSIVNSPNNTIGGSGPGDDNVIASNVRGGVKIEGALAAGNKIVKNHVIANSDTGVQVVGASATRLDGNDISRNLAEGVFIGNGSGTVLTSNLIGVDSAGLVGRPNQGPGVMIVGSPGTVIGADSFAEGGNVISGNDAMGIFVNATESIGTIISGNIIGLDRNAQNVIGNDEGVVLAGSNQGMSSKSTIRNNTIAGNRAHGVLITGGSFDNTIGGPTSAAANKIFNNGKAGVAFAATAGSGNAVLHNRIVANTALGIDLGDDGVSANDKNKDGDAGPNQLQNFPELSFATVGGSQRIVGTLASAPNTTYVLEFFANAAPDPTRFGEAERFLTTTAVTTNASGIGSFAVPLPDGEVVGTFITATATDTNGNTSEFAKGIRIEVDTDGDGVPDRLEGDAPSSGDGNQDGVPDSQQGNVTSLPSAVNGAYVTLVAPAGFALSSVQPLANPAPDDAPGNAYFGLGLFSFTVGGLTPGAGITIQQILPAGMTPQSYFRYGPTPDEPAPHWYNWLFDGSTGAVLNGNRVTLNFVDGLRGDDDLAANGAIVDPGGPAFPNSLLVTNALDSGPGSLRQAILDANNRPGFDFIEFAIGSGGPATISPLSDLPIITDSVFIDGTSQDGLDGSPLIELNGQGVFQGTGLTVRASDTTIQGLVINRFASAGISVSPPGNNSQNNVVIAGNFIGTDVAGKLARPNGHGIVVHGGAFHRIGGTTPETRNVISGNALDGIVLNGGFGMQVQGNYIGAAADGVSPLGNGDNGIRIPNISTAPFNLTIGGSISGAGNTIAFNGDSGISNLAPNRNLGFLSNSIYSNGQLGISRDPHAKVVLNDIGTSDTGGTNVQNYPVLSSAQSSGGQTTIAGYLNSRRNSTYTLQFFSNTTIDPTGFGEGQTLIGSALVATNANGRADFTINLPGALVNGLAITATATDASNNTSEFSRRVGVGEVLTNIIIVNSADDVDDGVADAAHTSLREAIHAANNFPGPNEIRFAIGSGIRTINVLTPLPAIVESVTIDGTTQPGFAGSPIIELNGASRVTQGFVGFPTTEFNDSSGLAVNASNTTIRGLVINRFAVFVLASLTTNPPSQLLVQQPFAAPGIDVYSIGAESSFGGVVIEGNYIGTDVTGLLPQPNSGGIHLRGGNNHRVGGTTPAQRNVISGNMGNGIDISTGNGHLLQGNFIGVGADGVTPLGNTTPDLVVDSRIVAYSSWGNGIGVNTAGTGNVTHTTIGGLQAGAGNLVAFNGRDGIQTGLPFAGNPILSNSIHSNRLLGISFSSHQVILNEQTLLFDSAGRIVKYPVIHSAESTGGETTISGHFDGAANANFLIQFFSTATVDASGFGEGEVFLGSTNVSTDASGHVDFTTTLPVAVPNRRLITATATDAAGSTSQFSRRQAVGEMHTGVFTVNTTDDVDDGTADATHTSLREAIHAANNHSGPDEIRFAIGSGVQTISPLTPLPAIVDSIVIDGWTQPGFTGTPIIELSGALMEREQSDRPSATSFYMHGIDVLANNSTVRGLVINRFLEFTSDLPGIGQRVGGQPLTVTGSGNVVEGVYVGTNVAGTSARENLERVRITGNNNRLGGTASRQRNLVAGGREGGIDISGDNNVFQGNFVGTDAAGNAAIPNRSSTPGRAAVSITGAHNVIGGGGLGAGNLISGNNLGGLSVIGPGNVIQGNFIGTNAAGTARLGNSGDGLSFGQSLFLASLPIIIGGTQPAERNIISGNSIGILVNGSDGVIQGNFIGTDSTGTIDLGNTMDGIFLNSGDGLLVGGTASGAGNLISGNDRFGILIGRSGSTGHRIQGNRIGTEADGVSALGNGSDGIAFGTDFFAGTNGTGSVDSLVGGAEAGAGNIIAFNTGRGVNVAAGQRIGILANSIFSNGQLGIDLNANGPTANDAGDPDGGDNALQNFPVLLEALTDGTRTSISGTLNSLANRTFVLQFFANATTDASGFGEGQTWLASRLVTTDGAGNASFTVHLNAAIPVGQVISATATDAVNNTSEFSQTIPVISGTVAPNQPPQAGAGGPYAIGEGDDLRLDGSMSSDLDGDLLSYSWDVNGDGTFGDATGVRPTLTWQQLATFGIVDGPSNFAVRVRVSDGQGHNVDSSPVDLRIANAPPVVGAGADQTTTAGTVVAFTGTVKDPGAADTHTYRWQVSASNGQVVPDGQESTFSFVPHSAGTYTVTLTVADDDGDADSARVSVTVNPLACWQNPVNARDVDVDGGVFPRDALIVINYLNLEVGPPALPPPPAAPPPYIDVNCDNFVSPADALIIINRLNELSGAEGESMDVERVELSTLDRAAPLLEVSLDYAGPADDSQSTRWDRSRPRPPSGPTSAALPLARPVLRETEWPDRVARDKAFADEDRDWWMEVDGKRERDVPTWHERRMHRAHRKLSSTQ